MAKMTGLERALAFLAKAPADLKPILEDQIETEAQDLVAAIKRNVPVLTGALRDSVKVLPGKHPLARLIVAGGRETTVKARSGVSDRDFKRAQAKGNNRGEFDYSRGVEFGHLTTEGLAVAARPFFFPTYRARKKPIRARFSRRARAAFKKKIAEINNGG